jgi:ABC-type amino acid transport substrate-binding protein
MRTTGTPRWTTRLGALAAALLLGGIAALPASAADLNEIRASGVLRVAAEPDTPPMLFSAGSRYDGFDWQVSRFIARSIGASSVVIVPGKYSELPGRLIAGRADVIISGYVEDEELSDISWSESYYDFGLCLVVRAGSDIRSVDDLIGKVVGIFNDPAAEDEVRKLAPFAERIEKHEDGYFELLASGEIDAFIYDYPYAQEEIKEFGDKLSIVQFNLTKSSYRVGVPAGNPTLLAAVNTAIASLRDAPAYGSLVRRYLGGSGPARIDSTRVAAGQKVYTVRPGDSLSLIAMNQLGSVGRWREIWELNRTRIADPNLVSVGWQLVLPTR